MTEAIHTIDIRAREGRAQLFEELYIKAFPSVAKYIHRNNGSYEDARDLFQDALVIYYEKLVAGSLDIHYSDTAYIMGIVKHMHAKRSGNVTGALEKLKDADDTEAYSEASQSKILSLLETAGRKCLDMLKAFYYDKMKPQEVADAFGYSGIRSATVQKYKCLEKLRDTVKEKSWSYADFTE